MTHFVGFTVARYGADLDALLAPYYEGREVPRYVDATRAEVIAAGLERIADYASPTGCYGQFLADPGKYVSEMGWHEGRLINPRHLNYLVNEFPQQLNWTDEQIHAHAVQFKDDVDEDGNTWSTYNPDSIWDWWVVGGRWDGDHAPGNRTSVHAYMSQLVDGAVPPRVLFDSAGVLRRGVEGWWGYTKDEHDDAAWRAAVIERLDGHDPADEVTFLDLHI